MRATILRLWLLCLIALGTLLLPPHFASVSRAEANRVKGAFIEPTCFTTGTNQKHTDCLNQSCKTRKKASAPANYFPPVGKVGGNGTLIRYCPCGGTTNSNIDKVSKQSCIPEAE